MSSNQQGIHTYRKPKVDKELRGMKDSTFDFSFEQIVQHCEKVTKQPGGTSNCIDVNCYFHKEYVECFSVFHDRKECVDILKK